MAGASCWAAAWWEFPLVWGPGGHPPVQFRPQRLAAEGLSVCVLGSGAGRCVTRGVGVNALRWDRAEVQRGAGPSAQTCFPPSSARAAPGTSRAEPGSRQPRGTAQPGEGHRERGACPSSGRAVEGLGGHNSDARLGPGAGGSIPADGEAVGGAPGQRELGAGDGRAGIHPAPTRSLPCPRAWPNPYPVALGMDWRWAWAGGSWPTRPAGGGDAEALGAMGCSRAHRATGFPPQPQEGPREPQRELGSRAQGRPQGSDA